MAFSQRDLRWRFKKLAQSGRTMGEIGCMTTAIAYQLWRDKFRTHPGMFCDWNNKNGGYTPGGLLIHSSVERYTQGKYILSDNPQYKLSTIIQVQWGAILHWVAKIGGLAPDGSEMVMDPWDGQFKPLAQSYWKPTGRRLYIIKK